MKQPFLFFAILISVLICSSCEQIFPPIDSQPARNNTRNDNTSSSFMASMRNLNHVNTYIEASNQQTIAMMEATVEIKVQFQALIPPANQIQDLSTEFHQYIDELKELMAQESEGVYTQFDAETNGNQDLIGMPKDGSNKKVVEQVFISGKYGGVNTQEQQGPALYRKLTQLRKDYLGVIANLWDNGGIRGSVFADFSRKERLLAQLSDDLLLTDYKNRFTEESWIEDNFKGKTIEETYVSLTQCQNQVNLSTAAVLKFISEQMGKLELTYDKFEVIAQSQKPYVLLGETYESEIALGAYSSQAKFSVSVEGHSLPITDGKARFSTRAASVGEKNYSAKISVVNPLTGETETFTKTFNYEVGQPAILVAADKQNVLYIGVNNPITVATAGIVSSAIKVSITGASIKQISSTAYTVNVTNPGMVVISVKNTKNGKTYPFQFRAKRIPDPVVRMGTNIDGMIQSSLFKSQPGLIALLEDFDYDATCRIKSYNLTYTRKRQDPILMNGKGGRFAGKVLTSIRQAKPGDQYSFTEIKVLCSGDKSDRRVNGLSFRIK